MDSILRGIILGLTITAPIGPTNIEVIRRGLKEGWQAAAGFCLGALCALTIYLVLVVLGLSYLAESAVFNTVLSILGIMALGFLSFNAFKDFFSGAEIELEDSTSGNRHFIPGFVLTISNPAVLLVWTGIMGADLAANQANLRQGLALSLGILAGSALIFAILTTLIHFGRRTLQRRYFKYVSLAAGTVLLGFCVRFAIDLFGRLVG